ncbi:MAG: enoyl-CoA hydratase-related protein [Pseudomonadota bacterium]
MSDTILIERKGRVVLVTLNRPKALNALNSDVMREMGEKLAPLDRDLEVGCFVIAGSEKAFAAGADIKEMESQSYTDMLYADFFQGWDAFVNLRTPKIAAVSGFALGGGCELAMMCDFIYCSASAKFGQPEIKLGVMPGMGGSQRLTKLIGRVKAMEMILTGRMMGAEEAERSGLVASIFDDAELLPKSLEAAEKVAGFGKVSALLAREAVHRADEVGLSEGLLFERRVFHSLFATEDQAEGMNAFVSKRAPEFKGS